MTEEDLIKGCCKNDRKAQRNLYDQYSSRMYVVALRYSKSQLEAEDILQESFIKVFSGIKDFHRNSKLATWITRIVINTALNHQRGKLYMFPMSDVESLEIEDGEVSLSRFAFEDLLRMIQSLPDGCQIIFNLYAIEGFTHAEIAEMLNISVGTSKSQYARAKGLLQNLVKKNERIRYENA